MDIYEESGILKSIPTFAALGERNLKLLAFASKLINFAPGQVIIRQGDPGDSLYILLEGRANVWIESAVESSIVREIDPNSIFGEIAVLRDTPRNATVVAATKLTAIKTSRLVVERLIEEDPNLGKRLEEYIEGAGYSEPDPSG